MSDFASKSVAELKLLCKSQGLIVNGLRKAKLVQLLQSSTTADKVDSVDTKDGEASSNSANVDNNGDDVIADDNNNDEEGGDDNEVNSESFGVKPLSSNDTLRLQIELAKLEIQRLKLVANIGESVTDKRGSDCVKIDKSLQGLLPRMSSIDSEALNFFHAFERVMQLYNVEKGSWALYLPANLNLHATKIYAILTLDQCKDYDTIKTEILTSFRLTSRSYYEQFIGSKKCQGGTFVCS